MFSIFASNVFPFMVNFKKLTKERQTFLSKQKEHKYLFSDYFSF